jgi:hypothetical protein
MFVHCVQKHLCNYFFVDSRWSSGEQNMFALLVLVLVSLSGASAALIAPGTYCSVNGYNTVYITVSGSQFSLREYLGIGWPCSLTGTLNTTGAVVFWSQSGSCTSYTLESSYTWTPTTDVTNFNLYPNGDQAKGITFSTQSCSIYSNPTGFSCPATNDYRLTISGPNAIYVSPTCVMSGRWETSVSPPIYLHHFASGARTSGCSSETPVWLTTTSGVVYSRQTSLYYPSHATWCSTQTTLSAAASPTTTPQDPASSPTSTAQSLVSPTTRQLQPASATPGMIFGPTTFLVSPPGTAAPHTTVSPLVRPQLFPTSDCQIRTQGAILTLVILLLVL